MKKLLFFSCLLLAGLSTAQNVGINTTDPKATLDVVGHPNDVTKADGLILPRLTLAQLNAKTSYSSAQTGALIYITDVTGGSTVPSTAQVTVVGRYYFDGTQWRADIIKAAVFTASLGTGAGGTLAATISANAFNTVVLPNVTKNIGGGIWDPVNYTYKVPISGTYIIKSSIRLKDGLDSPSRNIFQAVSTANLDIPDGIWQTNPAPISTGRWTMLYTRIAFFNAGDLLRLYIYSDGQPALLSDASLNITLISLN